MSLRSLLFTADEGAAEPIRQVLAGLGVEGEHCSSAAAAVERITKDSFQIVIIDWDTQPEAGLVLTAARERKASERPLTLAIVGDDASVSKALQAGANSILRKPILASQAQDTLTTARDLLRAKENAATTVYAAAAAASAGPAASQPARSGSETTLRAGEFLQSSGSAPGGQWVTESELPGPGEPQDNPVDPLKELEPVAASVAQTPTPPPQPPRDEPRGLEWYLKTRAGVVRPGPTAIPNATPTPTPTPAAPAKPELVGFDQEPSAPPPAPEAPKETEAQEVREQREEQKLFAYIDGEEEEPPKRAGSRFHLGKGAIFGALVLAACAVVAAPQAPWHPQIQGLWKLGQQKLHTWLNPQPVITAQAPVSHESFGRAGDEYKLPAVETIPDATTDPSQIQVVPVVDPTAKKPNNAGENAGQAATSADGSVPAASDPFTPAPGGTVQEGQPVQSVPPSSQTPVTAPDATAPAAGTSEPAASNRVPASIQTPPSLRSPIPSSSTPIQAPLNAQPQTMATPANVPSSLKSQMASMTPEASGNKPVEAAMQAIEPVQVPELTERALLADQPTIGYPSNVNGQQGTVILQVLIGRDGSVQDAKFQQGSLAFARTAIDGVKLWKFKPYVMNGRPVSVQTTMTMTFKPVS